MSESGDPPPTTASTSFNADVAIVAGLEGTDSLDVVAAANRVNPSARWVAGDVVRSETGSGTLGTPINPATLAFQDWCETPETGAPQPVLSAFAEFVTAEPDSSDNAALYIDFHQFAEIEHADRYVGRHELEVSNCVGIDLRIDPSGASGTYTLEAIPFGSLTARRAIFASDGSVAIRIPAGHVVVDVRVTGVTPGDLDAALEELAAAGELAMQAVLAEHG